MFYEPTQLLSPTYYQRRYSIATSKFLSVANLPASLHARITAKAKFPMYMTLNSTP